MDPHATSTPSPSPSDKADADVADDGQEEVFSRRAVERGLVKDPKALGPSDLAQTPKSPGSLARD